jgi:uncharacterized membrane protein
VPKEMQTPDASDTDSKVQIHLEMETVVGNILLCGVVLSMVLLGAGIAWHWAATRKLLIEYSIRGMNLFQFALSDEAGLASGVIGPRLLVSSGILVLMITPYIRVLASMLYFLFGKRNWKYSFFTGLVFTVLTYALLLH